jgi:hypothetical protein
MVNCDNTCRHADKDEAAGSIPASPTSVWAAAAIAIGPADVVIVVWCPSTNPVVAPWSVRTARAGLPRFGDVTPPGECDSGRFASTTAPTRTPCRPCRRRGLHDPHFDGYPAVLNELKTVTRPARREALIDGWLPWAPNDLVGDFIARARGRRRRHPATLATKRR